MPKYNNQPISRIYCDNEVQISLLFYYESKADGVIKVMVWCWAQGCVRDVLCKGRHDNQTRRSGNNQCVIEEWIVVSAGKMKRYLGVGWWGTWRRCGCLDGGDGRSCGVCGWVRMGNSDPRKNKKSPLHITSRQRGLISLRNFPLKPISACSRPPLLWPSWHYLHWPLKSLVYTISIPSGANWILSITYPVFRTRVFSKRPAAPPTNPQVSQICRPADWE